MKKEIVERATGFATSTPNIVCEVMHHPHTLEVTIKLNGDLDKILDFEDSILEEFGTAFSREGDGKSRTWTIS